MPPRSRQNLSPGDVLAGRYRVEGLLGQGGFGAVYRATELQLGRGVALKLVHPGLLERGTGLQRFRREADLARRLQHPNTVRLLDFGEDEDGTPYIAFELLQGQALDEVLAASGAMPAARVARVASQVLRSLMEAHALGIVHRDIKPSNIFLCNYAGEPDFVKILDFGIAKTTLAESNAAPLTATGEALGTPQYMAPERFTGLPITPAADTYSLGLVMAEALTGRLVFKSPSPMEVAMAQVSPALPPLEPAVLESPLGPVIRRATQKLPERRYASAREMLDDIEAAVRGAAPTLAASSWPAGYSPVQSSPPGPYAPAPPPIVPAATPAGYGMAHGPSQAPQQAQGSGSSGAVAVVVVALGLVLVAGAAGAWFFMSGSEGSSTTATTPAAASGVIPNDTAALRQRAWLSAQLKGHDNGMAALRSVAITEASGAFRVTIKNQFGFQCALKFSGDGRPDELRDCRGTEGWRSREALIDLDCEDRPDEEVCRGPYTLVAPDGFGQSAQIQIIRPRAGGP